MISLAIETTGPHLGLALHSIDLKKKTYQRRTLLFSKVPMKQSELLFPTLDKLLKQTRIKKNQIGLVIVDIGPGSFTGVRVGVASARALGQAFKIPVVGVSSLAAIARSKRGNNLVPWLPALSGEVYYDLGRAPVWGSKMEFEAALIKLRKLGKQAVPVTGTPHVRDVAELGLELFLKSPKKNFPYTKVYPLYLQPSWAERTKPR